MTEDLVDEAAARLAGVVSHTPLQRNRRLSAVFGADVWLKREDLQSVRSYKIRGAYNFLSQLPKEKRSRGVVCASAGNHAQGVALACNQLGLTGRIFLPRTTPRQKRHRIRVLGGGDVEVVLIGDTFDDAASAAQDHAARSNATLVPPFDDLAVVAGQGTVAHELVEQLGRAPDVVVVPVGGGGLLAGMASWLSSRHPQVRIVGVEPEGAPSMTAALAAGRPLRLDSIDTFVDGAAVRQVGHVTFPLVRDSGAEVVCVSEGRVCSEMVALYQEDGVIAEPAGALATASLGAPVQVEEGQTVVCLVSGGNNDISRYGEILERSLVHEGLKHYFLVEFPQEPGALRRFLDEVLGPEDDITLFEYIKRNSRETGPALVGIEIPQVAGLAPLLDRLDRAPLHVERVEPDSPLFRFLL